MTRLVLIGESNPYGTDPEMALFHPPRHASGNRLREHLGLLDATFAALAKVNLCTGKWSTSVAADRARELVGDYRVLVCLGVKTVEAVCRVLGWKPPQRFCAAAVGDVAVVALPHPSGLNRIWNEAGAREKAQAVLRGCAPAVPWGEVDG